MNGIFPKLTEAQRKVFEGKDPVLSCYPARWSQFEEACHLLAHCATHVEKVLVVCAGEEYRTAYERICEQAAAAYKLQVSWPEEHRMLLENGSELAFSILHEMK